MPKKFAGENSKSAVARARKEDVRKEQEKLKKKLAEDAYWEDDDKHSLKKQQRKENKEKKKQDVLDKKLTSKQLLEEEMNSIKSAKPEPVAKLTRAQITSRLEKKEPKPSTSIDEQPLVENLNRLSLVVDEARTVDEAIIVLGNKTKDVDIHPEKRLKAAFNAFEEANLERLKKENPTLRLSQVKQLLRKEWMKSPDNPLNNL